MQDLRLEKVRQEIIAGLPPSGVIDRAVAAQVTLQQLQELGEKESSAGGMYQSFLAAVFERTGDYSSAANLLEVLLVDRPDDFDLKARYGSNLIGSGQFVMGEAVLQAAIRDNPTHYWTAYHLALAPFRTGDYELSYQRLVDLTQRFEDYVEGFLKLAEAAVATYRWQAARDVLLGITDRFPKLAETAQGRLKLVDAYSALENRFSGSAHTEVRFINLERDVDRLFRMTSWCKRAGLVAERVDAVYAAALPAGALKGIRVQQGTPLGTLGCALSHVKLWEYVARSEKTSLILEDDAFPLFRIGRALDHVCDAAEFDFCFVNARMSIFSDAASGYEKNDSIKIQYVQDALHTRPTSQRGVGADGYLLTPAGARRLIEFIGSDGILGHVDWQLLSYAVDRRDIENMKDGVFRSTLASYLNRRSATVPLKAAMISLPFFEERSFGVSTRKAG